MPQQEQHHHFFKYEGHMAHDYLHMIFVCKTCKELVHVHRGTWNFLLTGR